MIYFDSAATTFQKPRTVADAMRNAMATMSIDRSFAEYTE